MSNSLCRNSVPRVYQEVIEDVINSVRDVFKDDGVDELILQELKQTWEAKLAASKAVHNEQEEKIKQKPTEVSTVNGFPKQIIAQPMHHPNLVNQHQVTQVVETKMVPIQITLPPQPGTDSQRVLTIQVPNTALHGNQLQKVLTGPVITATMGLPANIASSLLQQHVNAAFSSQQQAVAIVKQNIIQTDGQDDSEGSSNLQVEFTVSVGQEIGRSQKNVKKLRKFTNRRPKQVDGPLDTSDEDEEPSDDNDDEDEDFDEEKDEDNDMEDEIGEEEPLNSEDDVSDEDPGDLFDTDNIVVCQYDKIIRNRNKWKFYLKDGIMNLSGQDYVFQKANGDAEW
ncbi:transcription initiation factor IIA subunit 1 [Coccinella septempunctata]|uniref:transcription initiation factor IIA subunit 1 n=1 Tax=Coccinella septempunctata TaxID=41139 RepID=UPI001D08B916|nr:transcription initiation factor IIA subunit 1 [Coccinella septempunctata]